MSWTSIDEALPDIGEPVKLKINGVVQDKSYVLDSGGIDCAPWFEPYDINHSDEDKLWFNQASHWKPEPPEKEAGR